MMTEQGNDFDAMKQFWANKCRALEHELQTLQKLNCILLRQNSEKCEENSRLNRTVEYLNMKRRFIPRNEGGVENDECDVFFTFPEEVWPLILIYVNSSTDRLNLGAAAPLLSSIILDKDKPVWLIDQIFPIICNWLTDNEMLVCRMVCRKWNQAVENYLDSTARAPTVPSEYFYRQDQGTLYLSPVVEKNCLGSPPSALWHSKLAPLDFDDVPELSRFLGDATVHKQRYGKTLLISRSLKLGLNLDTIHDNFLVNHVNDFWETARNLLQTIGSNLWHIEIFNDTFEDDAHDFYELLYRLLCHLPNLKTLRIICEFERMVGWNEEQQLIYQIGTCPLPTLPHLDSLTLLHTMSKPMISAISTSYVRQIRKFVVAATILEGMEAEYLRGFINLSELVIRNCARNLAEFCRVLIKLEQLEAPNLEKLRLFRSYSNEETITSNYLLSLAHRTFPRLQSLDTHRMTVIMADGNTAELKENDYFLYSLRTLKIRHCVNVSFDFLRKLPNLEELYIRDRTNPLNLTVDYPQRLNAPLKTDTIARPDNTKQFLERTIWERMPKLKNLTYKSFDDILPSGRYSRRMYEYTLKQQNQ